MKIVCIKKEKKYNEFIMAVKASIFVKCNIIIQIDVSLK